MKRIFSAISLLIAMLFALLPSSAAVPDHLYIIGHGQGTGGVWEVHNDCPEGRKQGNMFVFENIVIPDGWGERVGTFGFVKDCNNSEKNGSDNYYGHSLEFNDDIDLVQGQKYQPLTYKAQSGFRMPMGTYTFTVDFTNEDAPTISVCSPEELEQGGQQTGNEYYGECPDLYISGEYVGWNNNNNLIQFNRNGNEYSVTVDSSTLGIGKSFKITTKDWTDNYGTWDFEQIKDYELPFAVMPVCQGEDNNFKCGDWGRFTIKFWYQGKNNPIAIYFLPEGYEGELPGISRPKPTGMSGTLPILYINVYTGGEDDPKTVLNNEIIDPELNHKNYFLNAEYWLDMNGVDWMPGAKNLGSEEEPLPLDIKARGNWTRRGFVKKPFKLKLGKKASMLGLTNSKHFAILAHADDNMGYLRNYVGFNLGKRIGLPWTPAQQPVEVVINGDYRGIYFLTESIRVDKDRVNIEERDDEDPEIAYATGGYIIEFDNYSDDDIWHINRQNCAYGHDSGLLYITPDTPEVYSDVQRDFVINQFNTMQDLVMHHNQDLWKYLDMDDAVRYYLVEEIISHYEAYNGSTYLFRDFGEGQKWHYSPLWDCGHAFEGGTNNYLYDCDKTYGNTWIRCLKDIPGFDDKLKATWKWFMSSQVDGLMDDIDTYCNHIAEAAKADRKRWEHGGKTSAWDSWEVQDNSDMETRKASVKDYLNRKISWLQSQWGQYNDQVYAEPERDTTPAAQLDSKYKDNLPVEWNEFESISAGTHHVDIEDHIVLGKINNPTTQVNLNLSKTTIEHDTQYLKDGEKAEVIMTDEGEVQLIAPVPGVYNVTLIMKEHRADENTYYAKTEFKQTVTVRPTFGGFGMSDAEISVDENGNFVINYTPVTPWAVKFWSSYGSETGSTGFDELYYTVLYPQKEEEGLVSVIARAEGDSEIPHGLSNIYDNEKGIDISGASGLKMAVNVSGAVSDPQEFSFVSQGGVVTGIEAVESVEAGDVRYYDLNGVGIAAPTVPGVYVRVTGDTVTKIVK